MYGYENEYAVRYILSIRSKSVWLSFRNSYKGKSSEKLSVASHARLQLTI